MGGEKHSKTILIEGLNIKKTHEKSISWRKINEKLQINEVSVGFDVKLKYNSRLFFNEMFFT